MIIVRHRRGTERLSRDEVDLRAERLRSGVADNPGLRSVLEAQSGKHPERLSPLIAPPPFNRASYEANPQAFRKPSTSGVTPAG